MKTAILAAVAIAMTSLPALARYDGHLRTNCRDPAVLETVRLGIARRVSPVFLQASWQNVFTFPNPGGWDGLECYGTLNAGSTFRVVYFGNVEIGGQEYISWRAR